MNINDQIELLQDETQWSSNNFFGHQIQVNNNAKYYIDSDEFNSIISI